jgi:hypothetical protein
MSTRKPLTSSVLAERWSWDDSLKFLPFLHNPFFVFRLGHGVVGILSVRMGMTEWREQGRMAENQFAASNLTEAQVGQFRFRQAGGVLPHHGHGFFPEQIQRRIEDALAVRMDRRMKHGRVHEHDVIRDLFNFQIGPELLLALRQDGVDVVQALGVAVADVKQGNAIYKGVHPQNLIDGQLADDVLVVGVLVVTGDVDLQVSDVIIQVCLGDRGAELAVQSHESLRGHQCQPFTTRSVIPIRRA